MAIRLNEDKEMVQNGKYIENGVEKTKYKKRITFSYPFLYYFVIKSNTPLINVSGCTGQPGIYKSIGYLSIK